MTEASTGRKAISKRLRFEILRRDNHMCRYCGATAPDVKLTVDHVVPVALGGKTEPENLVTACADCNSGKASTKPDEQVVANVGADALRWADAIRRAASARAVEAEARQEYSDLFLEAWERWNYGGSYNPKSLPLPINWRHSLWRFYEVGLPAAEMLRAVEIAGPSMAAPDATFRYFCGVCWSVVTEIQDAARALIEVQDPQEGA